MIKIKFEKITKKFALNNSYFKNRRPHDPSNPFEVLEYFKEYKELPYKEEISEDWFYECFIEYQKRAGVINDQFFTPKSIAEEMAYRLSMYANKSDFILEPCCGFGQITKALLKDNFHNIQCFDNDEKMVDTLQKLLPIDIEKCFETDFMNEYLIYQKVWFIISNPPFSKLADFLDYIENILYSNGIAVLLLPAGFLYKSRPRRLVEILNDFAILEILETKEEKFARTGIQTEIVVLKKI
ncbi:MAG: hypothetical protein ACRC0A_07090 [Chitinophagaceae bacterium]